MLWAVIPRVLFLLLPAILGPAVEWPGGKTLALNRQSLGSQREITDMLLQRCHLLCKKEHGQVKRKSEGKGGVQAEGESSV